MRRFPVFPLLVAAVLSASASSQAAAPAVWNVVALGDSDATGEGDEKGLGWVGRYERLLEQRLGLEVTVTNLAQNGQTSADLLASLRSNAFTRKAVRSAHIVLIGTGGADLGTGDERLEAGSCNGPEAC